MKFAIKNRWTRDVQFEAEIDCADETPLSVKIGLAVKWGVESGDDLSEANLFGANLSGANLCGADLSKANLCGANFFGANLSEANLFGPYLSGADLSGATGLSDIVAAMTVIAPRDVAYVGWKKCGGGACWSSC